MAKFTCIGLLLDAVDDYGGGIAAGVVDYAEVNPQWAYVLQVAIRMVNWSILRQLPLRGLITQCYLESDVRGVEALGLPVVNVSSGAHASHIPGVYSDNQAIGRLAARYYLDLKFRHFGYVGFPGRHFSAVRGTAFVRTLARAGFACSMFPPPASPPPRHRSNRQPGPSALRTQDLANWLCHLPKPVAVFVSHDHRAAAVMRLCQTLGLSVPSEVAVLGVDDEPLIHNTVPLSSIGQDSRRIGYEAAALMDRLLRGQQAPSEPILIPPRGLTARKSTQVTSVDNPTIATVQQYIRENAMYPIGVPDLLRRTRMSRRTLERQFQEVVGHSPLEEIRQARIDRAKHLLTQTSLSIQDVAYASGFADAGRLSIVFRQQTSQTPRQYRQQHQSSAVPLNGL